MRKNGWTGAVAGILLASFGRSVEPPDAEIRERALATLRQVLAEEPQWVKVHAAESLLRVGRPERVYDLFRIEEQEAGPFYRIGVWRVLAQAAPSAGERAAYVERIAQVFLDLEAPDRLHAVETLAKLGYDKRPPELLRYASEEPDGLGAYARWALMHSGGGEEEAALAALLASDDPVARLRAGYALRCTPAPAQASLDRLRAAARAEAGDSIARVYLLAAAYLHSSGAERAAFRAGLEPFLDDGSVGQKREALAVFGRAGEPALRTRLLQALDDPAPGVRSAAAESVLMLPPQPPGDPPG